MLYRCDVEIVENKLRGQDDVATQIKNAYVKSFLPFHFRRKTVLTLYNQWTTTVSVYHTLPLLKQIYSFPTLMQLLPFALETTPGSHTVFLPALPNQFNQAFFLRAWSWKPISSPRKHYSESQVNLSLAPPTVYNYNSLCTQHLIIDAYYFAHKLFSFIHVYSVY